MYAEMSIERQKNSIQIHRLVFLLFIGIRIYLQFVDKEVEFKNTAVILGFMFICALCEEVLYRMNYFNSSLVIKVYRFAQCVLTIAMFCFVQNSDTSDISLIAVFLVYLIDYFLSMDIIDKSNYIFYCITIGITIISVLFIKMSASFSSHWNLVFLNMLLLMIVLLFEGYALVSYMDVMHREVRTNKNKLSDVIQQKDKITAMQNKLQDTNYELNVQKNDLQKANKIIKAANEEMTVQTEILHYIASSFDIEKISRQIIDAIMRIKHLKFGAVYVCKNVYRNKHEKYTISSDDIELDKQLKEHLADLYQYMIDTNQNEIIINNGMSETFSFLKPFSVFSIYMKRLGMGEDRHGLFILGDINRNAFSENMSFYNAIVAQYDIAIGNAQIYNDMQHMAQKDGLTGINNRIYFNELFSKESKKIVENNGHISVALFDIDKFKSVNDTYGHLAGDEVIKRIATVTEDCIDRYDGFVCRYGGEEFVAVLPDKKLNVAEEIIKELFDELCKQVIDYNEYHIPMSVSVGLTSYPEVCKDTADLLKRADWSMYYAKEHGRHQIKVDDGVIEKE